MRLSRWVISSEAVTKTRQTYFGTPETIRPLHNFKNSTCIQIIIQCRLLSKLHNTCYEIQKCRDFCRIFTVNLTNRKFLSLRFTRNHDENGAKRSTRVDFSLSDEFSPPSDLEHFSGNSGAPREYTDYLWATRVKSMGLHWDSFQAR